MEDGPVPMRCAEHLTFKRTTHSIPMKATVHVVTRECPHVFRGEVEGEFSVDTYMLFL
jgi:hypothetical protein